jgi:hypothetical protein
VKALSARVQEKFGVSSEVLGNVTGLVYAHHLVVRCDSLAQLEDVTAKMQADPDSLAWFGDMQGPLARQGARQNL